MKQKYVIFPVIPRNKRQLRTKHANKNTIQKGNNLISINSMTLPLKINKETANINECL